MKKRSSFGVKLWLWFALFAAAIFAALWLLQTVFLQRFYNDMAIRGAERALREIAARAGEADFYETIDRVAGEDALLVFVTDGAGNVLYSADEYQGLYGASGRAGHGGENPWRAPDREMNWEKGAARNLPDAYGAFAAALKSSGADSAGVVTEDNGAYVTGLVLDGGDILCLSRPLGTVGGTVEILRLQLLWVSALSLLLGFALAWAISRRFARPVTQIARSARRIAEGDYRPELPKGFCAELDELADTLEETAWDLERAQNAQRELLANVSHDLRTPLTMIKGYAEMVRDISWEDEARRTDDLDIIIREADRLTALVNEILEFSSARADSAGKERAVFDLSRAVREVAGQFAPFRDRDGLTVETAVTDGLWVQGTRRASSGSSITFWTTPSTTRGRAGPSGWR